MKINKRRILINYQKSKDLISKIISTIERNENSIDIIEKNVAIIRFFKVIHKNLMEDYLKLCFNKGVETKNRKKKGEMTREILKAMSLLNK